MRFVKTAESILNIPNGFQRVAYLESTETQYIDTGFALTANSTLDFTFSPNEQSGLNLWFCGSYTTNTKLTGFRITSSTSLQGYIDNTSSISVSGSNIGKKYHCVMNSTNWSVNGTDGTSATQVAGRCNLTIFGWNAGQNTSSPSIRGMCSAKMYYFKISDNGVLVRDLIPCIDPLGVPCLYDLVGKKPYYNQGTGEFTYGRKIIPVEYLQSSGTQYIDTGYIPSNTTGQYAKMQYTTVNNGVTFGGMVSGNGVVGPYYATNSDSYWWIRWGTNEPKVEASSPTTSNTYEMYLNFNNDRVAKVNNIVISDSLGNISGNYPSLTLFRRNFSAGYAYLSGKLYKYQITEGTDLVRDYIPCKDENGVGFMFDKVSGTCYLNAGTGAFVVGQNKYKMKLRLIRDNILPTGYTQLEYIESTGPQYIDTGIVMKSTNKIECRFQALSATTGNQRNYIFGADTVATGVQYSYSSSTFFGVAGRYQQNDVLAMNTDIHLAEVYDGKIYLDGVSLTLDKGTGANPYTSTKTIHLFGFNDTNGHTNPTVNDRVYYYKMWDNNVLIQDLIPAIDPSGTPCMYDLVSRTSFYNQGTGTFTTGKPVLPVVRFPVDPVPVGYKTVNYLESSGTQYIDTGYSFNSNTDEIELYYQNTSTLANKWLFGSYENNAKIGISSANLSQVTFWYKDNVWNAVSSQYDKKHILKYDSSGMSNDGTNLKAFTSYSGTWHIYLFALNNTGTSVNGYFGYGKIYSYKHKRNGVLVRNFIPVIRLLDNKAGLWDTVTKQFFGNAGTGDFITG